VIWADRAVEETQVVRLEERGDSGQDIPHAGRGLVMRRSIRDATGHAAFFRHAEYHLSRWTRDQALHIVWPTRLLVISRRASSETRSDHSRQTRGGWRGIYVSAITRGSRCQVGKGGRKEEEVVVVQRGG
jgi:hypothetical protein